MDIYVEYVIIDNMAIDSVLLYLTCRISGAQFSRLRMFIGAGVGTIIALLLPFVPVYGAAAFAIKVLSGALVFFAGIKCRGVKRTLSALAVFFAATFVLGGAFLAALMLTGSSFHSALTLSYESPFPAGLIILPVFFGVLLLVRLAKQIERRKGAYPFLRTVKICAGGQTLELKAFIDSGNRLFDAKNKPVSVITYNAASKLLGAQLIKLYLTADGSSYITMYGADGAGKKLLSFYAQKLDILNSGQIITHENVPFAILMKEFRDADAYDVLLSPSLIE